jgi:hypothetical protein
MTTKELIRKYEGVTELPPNKGFKQTWFEKLIQKVGWYKGAPWCSFAVKVFWLELFGEQWAKCISGNALKTYLNLQEFKNTIPIQNGLVVWRMYKKGKPTKSGHIGLVTDGVFDRYSSYSTLEGNTSQKLIRDGQGIFHKYHNIRWRKPSDLLKERYTGLVLLGFIDPPFDIRKSL